MSAVHVAAFRVRAGRVEVMPIATPDEPLRAASVLKPLLFWAACDQPPLAADRERWERMAGPATVYSANEPTVELWNALGSQMLLDELDRIGGGPWRLDPVGSGSFGSVLCEAVPVAEAYGALAGAALAEDETSARLLDWMTMSPDEMTFGAREAATDTLGADPGQVAVKTGWDCNADEQLMRTHAVTVVPRWPGEAYGAVVLTALPFAERERGEYARAYRMGQDVLEFHQRRASERIQAATGLALEAIVEAG